MKLTLTILLTSAMVACGQDYTFSIFASGFALPTDVAVDSAGNVYVADYNHSKIQKIDPNGDVTTLAGSGACGHADGTGIEATFRNPVGVAVDSAGNVYVSDRGNRLIRKITSAGVVTTIAGIRGACGEGDCGCPGVEGGDDGLGSDATFKYTHGVSVDSAGNVYVADREGATVRKLTPDGTNYVVTTIAGLFATFGQADGTNNDSRFNNDSVSGVPVDSAGNVYAMDRTANVIRKITPDGTNYVTTTIAGTAGQPGDVDGTGSDARFRGPYNGTVDSAGNLFVADTYNHTIRKITLVGPDWVVTTVPGSLDFGFGGDSPFGVAVDSAGNLYAADYNNNRVAKGIPPTPPPVLNITRIQFVSGNVQIDFTADPGDTFDLFTLQSSGTVNGTYNDDGSATISQVGPPGSFRAVTAPSGSAQFYRIKR